MPKTLLTESSSMGIISRFKYLEVWKRGSEKQKKCFSGLHQKCKAFLGFQKSSIFENFLQAKRGDLTGQTKGQL